MARLYRVSEPTISRTLSLASALTSNAATDSKLAETDSEIRD